MVWWAGRWAAVEARPFFFTGPITKVDKGPRGKLLCTNSSEGKKGRWAAGQRAPKRPKRRQIAKGPPTGEETLQQQKRPPDSTVNSA